MNHCCSKGSKHSHASESYKSTCLARHIELVSGQTGRNTDRDPIFAGLTWHEEMEARQVVEGRTDVNIIASRQMPESGTYWGRCHLFAAFPLESFCSPSIAPPTQQPNHRQRVKQATA